VDKQQQQQQQQQIHYSYPHLNKKAWYKIFKMEYKFT